MGRYFVVPATYPLLKLSFCAYGVGALRVGGGFLTAPGLLTLSFTDINRTGSAAATSPGHSVSCGHKCPFIETYFYFQKNIFVTLKRREECCGGGRNVVASRLMARQRDAGRLISQKNAYPDYRNITPQIFSKYPARPCLVNSFKREQQYINRDCLSTCWSGRLSPSLNSDNDCCRISDCAVRNPKGSSDWSVNSKGITFSKICFHCHWRRGWKRNLTNSALHAEHSLR
jgi:hypothetical protein